jgi:hypothetical protein
VDWIGEGEVGGGGLKEEERGPIRACRSPRRLEQGGIGLGCWGVPQFQFHFHFHLGGGGRRAPGRNCFVSAAWSAAPCGLYLGLQ